MNMQNKHAPVFTKRKIPECSEKEYLLPQKHQKDKTFMTIVNVV